VHAGASADVSADALLVVGSADDCDLILTDEGISSHHCVLGQLGGTVFVRAVQGTLAVGKRSLGLGEQLTLQSQADIQVGSVSISLHAHLDVIENARFFSGLWPYWLALIGLTSLLVIFVFLAVVSPDKTADQANRDPAILGLSNDDLLAMQAVSGKQKFDASSPGARHLARQVKEVFRLSGLSVQANAVDDGVIEVTGRFADDKEAEMVVHSRALREIKALRQVRVVNVDANGIAKTPDRKIVRLTAGLEPYFVTADGARFYLGARLKSGFTVIAIEEEHVRLVSDIGEERVLRAGALLE
jgi:hypothetical protein